MNDSFSAERIQALIDKNMQASPQAVPQDLQSVFEQIGPYTLSTVKDGLIKALNGPSAWRLFGLSSLLNYDYQVSEQDAGAIEACLDDPSAEVRVHAALVLYGRAIRSEALYEAVNREQDPAIRHALLSCALGIDGIPEDRVRDVARDLIATGVPLTRDFLARIVQAVTGPR